ncbi:MAG TPA: inositol 2-dehydrogenase [Victivallales bacterium]|nr:inositol 2-dehydrogenase [Victivallales bacterium]
MSNKMTVAVIGGGRIGKVHAESIINFIPEVEIKCMADTWAGAGEWAEQHNIPFTTDIDSVFTDIEIDAVLICTATDTHVKYIIEAANAKKHIFCEKPIDQDINKINEAIQAVKENNVKFQIGFNRRFDHNFKAAKQAIEDGKVGDVRFVNITSRDPGAPPIEYVKVSGGMFMDMTIHDFDMARFLAGSEVEEVYAKGAVMVDPEIGKAGDVDSAAIILKFKNGAIGMINNCREASYGYDQRAEVFGSKGAVEIKNDTGSTASISTSDGVVSDKPLYFFMDRYTQSYVSEIKDFVDAVTNNKPTPTNTTDGLKSVEIARAATESAKTGLPVKL